MLIHVDVYKNWDDPWKCDREKCQLREGRNHWAYNKPLSHKFLKLIIQRKSNWTRLSFTSPIFIRQCIQQPTSCNAYEFFNSGRNMKYSTVNSYNTLGLATVRPYERQRHHPKFILFSHYSDYANADTQAASIRKHDGQKRVFHSFELFITVSFSSQFERVDGGGWWWKIHIFTL